MRSCSRKRSWSGDLVELDDVGMVEQFEYLHLAVHFAQVVVIETRLVDYLYCDLQRTKQSAREPG